MAEAIEKAKLLFTTGYFMRTDPKHMFLKEQVAKGAFGTVTRIRGSNCHSGSLGGWFDTEWRWMADPKQAGVGAFGDLGTHSLDIMMWIIGDVVNATAEIATVTARYGKETDETGEGLMTFQSGTIGTLAANPGTGPMSYVDTTAQFGKRLASFTGLLVGPVVDKSVNIYHRPGAEDGNQTGIRHADDRHLGRRPVLHRIQHGNDARRREIRVFQLAPRFVEGRAAHQRDELQAAGPLEMTIAVPVGVTPSTVKEIEGLTDLTFAGIEG